MTIHHTKHHQVGTCDLTTPVWIPSAMASDAPGQLRPGLHSTKSGVPHNSALPSPNLPDPTHLHARHM